MCRELGEQESRVSVVLGPGIPLEEVIKARAVLPPAA